MPALAVVDVVLLLLCLGAPVAETYVATGNECGSADCAAEDQDSSALLQHRGRKSKSSAGGGSHRDERPNILYIVLDQWRWDWAGFDPINNVTTPRVTALAAEGVRFDHAYSPAPLCVPSRCAFAAGRSAHSMWVTDNHQNFLPGEGPTYLKLLQDAGYRTMIVGKDHLNSVEGVGIDGSTAASDLGYDVHLRTNDKYENTNTGVPRDPYGAYLDSLGLFEAQAQCYGGMGCGACCNKTPVCESSPLMEKYHMQSCGFLCEGVSVADEDHDVDSWVVASGKAVLEEHYAGEYSDQPWYLSVGFPSPHPPFVMSPSMRAEALKRPQPPAVESQDLDPVQVLEARQSYAVLVEKLDRLIGELLDALDASGRRENTLVIVTSDHGEHLGERGYFGKNSAWDASTRVPLVVSGPGIQQGKVVTAPTETLDLVGTMLEYAGAAADANMETLSLKPFLTGEAPALPRKDVRVGLSSLVGGSNFSAVVRQCNSSLTLKLVCCPTSDQCIKGRGLLPPGISGEPQAALVRVGATSPGDLENVLGQSGRGCAEARDLLASIPAAHQRSCATAIDRLCPA